MTEETNPFPTLRARTAQLAALIMRSCSALRSFNPHRPRAKRLRYPVYEAS
jgi:hypothetical protein